MVRVATGASVDLSKAEFEAVRELLEEQQTWSLLGHGTVAELEVQIASCLPAQEGRTSEDSQRVAMVIARGLLEFAVADLEPGLFQRLLLARLDRMETNQASALDKALFDLQADLVVCFAEQRQLEAQHFSGVMGSLRRVLDRLPPDSARNGEIALYLQTLIDWLNSDPWPRDRRFKGSALTPSAIEAELHLAVAGQGGKREHVADNLAEQCQRLVILGGAGSGKTWLAKRIARRCAEKALQALADGGTIDEIELPLYVTCSRLFSAEGDIRLAAVSSALYQLGDLGGSRLIAAFRRLFTERNAPTLLVIDSLDEAPGSDDRLRQADTLPWRIVLTSRPSSWNDQLAVQQSDDAHRVGEIKPLRYPYDVDLFIQRWFSQDPDRGIYLAGQIARRRDLQQAATVPLILAFYCIVGGDEALPDFRRDLYTRVLKRMLTGRWRGNQEHQADVDTCLRVLRDWAWAGVVSDPLTGIGTWADDVPTERVALDEADERAVNHVATPLGPADVDTATTLRRFVHRSIREHLVAEHVARLPADLAAQVLLPHIWYDPDWEYSIPAALAGHPERDRLLRALICRAAQSGQLPEDLSVIDGGQEFRELLVRIAAESREADWSPQLAEMIGQARVGLTRSGRTDDLGGTAHWPTSNRQAREGLFRLLADGPHSFRARELVDLVVQLAPAPEDKRHAREALLRLLADQKESLLTELARGVRLLDPTPGDLRAAREALLGLLPTQKWMSRTEVDELVLLAPASEDKRHVREALLRLLATRHVWSSFFLRGVAQLVQTAEDRRQTREALLMLVPDQSNYDNDDAADKMIDLIIQVAPSAEEKREACHALLRLLGRHTYSDVNEKILAGVTQLAPTAQDKRYAREVLLGLIAGQRSLHVASWLLRSLVQLSPTAEDVSQARGSLFMLLASQSDSRTASCLRELASLTPTANNEQDTSHGRLRSSWTDGHLAGWAAGEVVQFALTAKDKGQARDTLLAFLSFPAAPDDFSLLSRDATAARKLVNGLLQLTPTPQDKRQCLPVLLGLLVSQADNIMRVPLAEVLVDGVVQLATEPEGRCEAREALLGLLAMREDGGWAARTLVGGVVRLALTPQDQHETREALFELIRSQPGRWVLAKDVASAGAQLSATEDDKKEARRALLGLLASQTDAKMAEPLINGLITLDLTAEDRQEVRDALLRWLATPTEGWVADKLVRMLIQLTSASEEQHGVRDALLGLLASLTDNSIIRDVVNAIVQFTQTPDDRRRVLQAFLGMLVNQRETWSALCLTDAVANLDPTPDDQLQIRKTLLELAAHADEDLILRLVDRVMPLARLAEDQRRTRDALLGLLATQTDQKVAEKLVEWVITLTPAAPDKHQVRESLLGMLANETGSWAISALLDGILQLDPTVNDKERAREALLSHLAKVTHSYRAEWLVNKVVQLSPTIEDKRQARKALVGFLAKEGNAGVAEKLVDGVVQLGPTVSDLGAWREWAVPPSSNLLAAVRQRSPLADWLAALPAL